MRLKISEAAMHVEVEVDVDDQDSDWACGI